MIYRTPAALVFAALLPSLAAGAQERDVVAELQPGAMLWELDLREGDQLLYVLDRGETVSYGLERGIGPEFDRLFPAVLGSRPGTLAYRALRDSQTYVVAPSGSHAVGNARVDALMFLEGARDCLWRERISGRGTFWVFDGRRVPEDPRALEVDGVDQPVFDADGRFVAYRERTAAGIWRIHLTGGACNDHTWASRPAALLAANASPHVLYRSWDGDAATLHVGATTLSASWIGEPVQSPDGQHLAFVIHSNSHPAQAFARLAEEETWLAQAGQAVLQSAHEGGECRMVVTDLDLQVVAEYPSRSFLGQPVFSPDGARVAYPARDGSQAWSLVESGPEGSQEQGGLACVVHVAYTGDGRPAYATRHAGGRAAVHLGVPCDQPRGALVSDSFEDFLAAADRIYYRAVDGGASFGVTHPSDERPRVLGPYEDLKLHGLLTQGNTAYGVARESGKSALWTASVREPRYVEHLFEPVHAPSGGLAYVERDGRTHRFGFVDATGTFARPAEGEFTSVARPLCLDSGAIVFMGALHDRDQPAQGYASSLPIGNAHLSVFHDGRWTHTGPLRALAELTPSPTGTAFAVAATLATRSQVLLFETRGNRLRRYPFDVEGRPVALGFLADGSFVYVDKGPSEDAVHHLVPLREDAGWSREVLSRHARVLELELSPAAGSYALRIGKPGHSAWAIGGNPGRSFETIDEDPVWHPAEQMLAHRAHEGGIAADGGVFRGGSAYVHVVSHTFTWTSPGYEFVSSPRFTEGGRMLEFAAQEGAELVRMRLSVQDLASSSALEAAAPKR